MCNIMNQKNNLTRWQRARRVGKGTLNQCRFACRTNSRPANRQPTLIQGAFFHVYSISNTETVAQKRAEPLARPCSFALLHRLSDGTRSGRWIGATVGVHTLLQLYPHSSTPYTTSYRSTSGYAPLNKCTLSSKTASWCGAEMQGRTQGEIAQRPTGRNARGAETSAGSVSSDKPSLISYLAWGVRGGLCPSPTISRR